MQSIKASFFRFYKFIYNCISSFKLLYCLQLCLGLLRHCYKHLLNFAVSILSQRLLSRSIHKSWFSSAHRFLEVYCWLPELPILQAAGRISYSLCLLKLIIVESDCLASFVLEMGLLNELNQMLLVKQISLCLKTEF